MPCCIANVSRIVHRTPPEPAARARPHQAPAPTTRPGFRIAELQALDQGPDDGAARLNQSSLHALRHHVYSAAWSPVCSARKGVAVHLGRREQAEVSFRRRCLEWVRRRYALSLQYLSSSENVTNAIHIAANGTISFSSAPWSFPSCQCNSRAGSLDAPYLSAFMLSFDTTVNERTKCKCFLREGDGYKSQGLAQTSQDGNRERFGFLGFAHRVRQSCSFISAFGCSFSSFWFFLRMRVWSWGPDQVGGVPRVWPEMIWTG